MSIKPQYSDKIFSGKKKYEFRRQRPRRRIKLVFVYESGPSKRIVGWFTVKRIISGSPNQIWEKCGEVGGIDKEDFFQYCGNRKTIYAFQIEETFQFENPIVPSEVDPFFCPPQSFSYFDSRLMMNLIKGIQRDKSLDNSLIEFPNLMNL